MRVFLYSVSFLMIGSGVAGAESLSTMSPFLGNWTMSQQLGCDNHHDGLITIEPTRIVRHESSCMFDALEASSRSFSADLSCDGEGEEWTETVQAFSHAQDRVTLRQIVDTIENDIDLYRCASTTISPEASVTPDAPVHPEVVENARMAIREAYSTFQIVEYCEKAGFDNYGYSKDDEFRDAIKRIEALTGEDADSLERTWSEVRVLVIANLEQEETSRMAGVCSLVPDRISRIVAIADGLENFQPEPEVDVMPSTSRPF